MITSEQSALSNQSVVEELVIRLGTKLSTDNWHMVTFYICDRVMRVTAVVAAGVSASGGKEQRW